MTRDEELKAIEEAIKSGKLQKVCYETTTYVPTKMQLRTARAVRNNKNNAAKRINSKSREAKYRDMGLSILIAATLVTTWPDGTTTKSAAIDNQVCLEAANHDLKTGAISAYCITNLDPISAGFKPGFDCIRNYNC